MGVVWSTYLKLFVSSLSCGATNGGDGFGGGKFPSMWSLQFLFQLCFMFLHDFTQPPFNIIISSIYDNE